MEEVRAWCRADVSSMFRLGGPKAAGHHSTGLTLLTVVKLTKAEVSVYQEAREKLI